MRRGTTPTHTFTIPNEISVPTLEVIYITYSQFGRTVLEKDIDDLLINNQKLSITLTQEETLSFKDGTANVQIRCRSSEDIAYASDIKTIKVETVQKKGII